MKSRKTNNKSSIRVNQGVTHLGGILGTFGNFLRIIFGRKRETKNP